MAQKTKAQLITELEANITDNTANENTAARVREIIQDVIDSTLNIIDKPQPLLYKVLLTQANTDAPEPAILVDDFNGGITLSYIQPGVYRFVSSGLFTNNKTFYGATLTFDAPASVAPRIRFNKIDDTNIQIEVGDDAGFFNDLLNSTPFFIEVYP